MESIIEIFGTQIRGDFFLVLVTAILATIIASFQIIVTSRRKSGKDKYEELISILSKPEILELIKADKITLSEILESSKKDQVVRKNPIASLFGKIADDIEWDIAGVIGVGVTIVLLFMVVSGTIDKIPEQIFTGWLLILGYYFGKSRKQN